MDNLIVWADIPVTDLDRAMKFYGAVLQRPFMTMPGMESVALPAPDQPPGAGARTAGRRTARCRWRSTSCRPTT